MLGLRYMEVLLQPAQSDQKSEAIYSYLHGPQTSQITAAPFQWNHSHHLFAMQHPQGFLHHLTLQKS